MAGGRASVTRFFHDDDTSSLFRGIENCGFVRRLCENSKTERLAGTAFSIAGPIAGHSRQRFLFAAVPGNSSRKFHEERVLTQPLRIPAHTETGPGDSARPALLSPAASRDRSSDVRSRSGTFPCSTFTAIASRASSSFRRSMTALSPEQIF